jgi:hypothetical protein
MKVCAHADLNAKSASGNAISKGNYPVILSRNNALSIEQPSENSEGCSIYYKKRTLLKKYTHMLWMGMYLYSQIQLKGFFI